MSRTHMRVVARCLVLVALIWPIGGHAAGPLPGLWVTPLELDFGEVPLNTTSATQKVIVRNTGDTTLTNFAGGAPFDSQFGAGQNCAGGVAPGASCEYFYTFTPTATGVFSTTSYTLSNAGIFIIKLKGTGTAARLSVSPLELDFGEVPLNSTSATQQVTIRNMGSTTLTNFAGGAPFDTQFGAAQNCAGGVAPGASCQYFFTFTPTAAGVFSTTSNSSTNAGPIVITLRGSGRTGAAPAGPQLSVSPPELDFGEVPLNTTSAIQKVTIRNTGSTTLSKFAGGAPFDTQFGAAQNCAGGVAPGASCQYTFAFTPTATGVFSTTSNSQTNAGDFIIKLKGTGTGARLSVSPLELDFGEVPLNTSSATQKVTIRNIGSAPLTDFAGGAPFDTQFGAAQNCAGGVAPGASCQYTFSFTPTATGVFSTTSNTLTNAGPFVITLRGQSGPVAPAAVLSFSPSEITVGTVSRMELGLTNLNRATVVDDVALELNLPPGIRVAASPQFDASGCGSPSINAVAGAATVTLAGAQIGRSVTCQFQVDLIGTAGGDYVISTGLILSSNSGVGSGSSAALKVVTPVAPPPAPSPVPPTPAPKPPAEPRVYLPVVKR